MKAPEKQPTVDSSSKSESGSWQLRFVLFVIAIGVLGLIAKTLGLF